jgi:two-component system OmpR family sensor kinase
VSIRLRVTLATVALSALAVGAADLTTFVLLSDYFNGRAEASVRQVANTAVVTLKSGEQLTLPRFAGSDRPVLIEVRSAGGKILQRLSTSEASQVHLPSGLFSRLGRARQFDAQGDPGPPALAAIAVPVGDGRTVVAVVSVKAEASTLAHLFRLDVLVGLIVLAVLAVVAAVVLARSLRPLLRIAETADEITSGTLAARVPPASKRSEIGRVGTALNKMLTEIEAAFAQRDATEDRLRQFLADASHELRTPLTSIRGYAELFHLGADHRPEDLAKAMRAIEEEATHMTVLVEDLLLLARLDDARPLEKEPVALDDVVESAIAAARAVEPDRSLQFDFAARPLLVDGDRRRLRQVLDNLLANVRQHTPRESPALVSLRASDGRVVLTVEDTGPGIREADRARVFDRFVRPEGLGARRLGGAGLGLAIVRAIVTAHHGEIAVRQAYPHGAIFEIHLPASAGASAEATSHRAPGVAAEARDG